MAEIKTKLAREREKRYGNGNYQLIGNEYEKLSADIVLFTVITTSFSILNVVSTVKGETIVIT